MDNDCTIHHGGRAGTILFCCLLLAAAACSAACTEKAGPAAPSVPAAPAVTQGSTLSQAAAPLPAGTCSLPFSGALTESPGYASGLAATELLTRPTADSVTVSIVPQEQLSVYSVYGTAAGSPSCRTPAVQASAGTPVNWTMAGLSPDTEYHYRLCYTGPGSTATVCGPEHAFHTERAPGSTFVFGVQADSHPERQKTMFDPALYRQTLQNVAQARPDFYVSLGDDFSIDPLLDKNQATHKSVNSVYLTQREYLGAVGSSAPIFLVNGNHEQAARYLLDGTAENAAIYAGTARMAYFPQPVPDGFYTGDTENVQYIGSLGDYYAWQWGDALFVVIDPYWHSSVAVDNVAGAKNSHGKKDLWDITLGEAQYQWLKKTLEGSDARYKFVFSHHVLGTGRGGVEEAGLYEWGGSGPKGSGGFGSMRPGWAMPIQELMARTNVTIFFQGHDHLFARQELGGVTYQEVPIPADPTYSIFNTDAYTTGTKLPNTGYLRVTVSPANTTVDYVRTYLPGAGKNGEVAYSYSLPAR